MSYLFNTDHYNKLNHQISDQVSQFYKFNLKVKVFQTATLAIYDLCFGLSQFLAHKPKVALAKDGTGLFESILPKWYRLQTPVLIKKNSENWNQFFQNFDTEVNYFIYSSFNEITSEIIHTDEVKIEIYKTLNSKRIYIIELIPQITAQHILWMQQFPYLVYVQVPGLFQVDSQLTYIFSSDKLKAPDLIGSSQDLSLLQKSKDHNWALQDVFANNLSDIKAASSRLFESDSLNYFNRFATKVNRRLDRWVILNKWIAASLFKSEFNYQSECFVLADFSLTQIQSVKSWWSEAESSEFVSGIVILDASQINLDDTLFLKIKSWYDLQMKKHQWEFTINN